MAMLKPGMLAGVQYKEVFEVEYEGEKYEVEIRALKHTEASEIQAILATGIKLVGPRNDVQVDTEKMTLAQFKAQLKATAFGTVEAGFTEAVIENEWPSELISKVGARIMTISGIGNPEEVKTFRSERKGN